jgi:hypothetical protein
MKEIQMRHVTLAVVVVASCLVAACSEKKPASPAPAAPVPASPRHAPGHGGAVIALGAGTIGGFSVVATRDQGPIVAGKDAPIDVTVTPADGGGARPTAVRFWIGVEDGAGSVKARAEIENPAEPNRWHTHAEIPSPLPAGSKLWVEIEDQSGAKATGSFDLKM